MLKNPILPGFHADPCLCRRGDDYYIAVSSFEWFPGVPVYHSRDLKNWKLLTHCLTEERLLDLRRLPSAKGVWAPCLTWCEQDGLFYLVYSIMNNMNADFFDVDNYLITAPEITGPWSDPVYLHSAGFDASLFHDDDGRKWLSSLEWETRVGYEQPGAICLTEYDPVEKRVKGAPKRIWSGGTDRGCIEGPHIYKRDGWYYLLCAEGGTGYGHCVTMGRSRQVQGPYEGDPANPILTSTPQNFNERQSSGFLKPQYYNPDSVLQKSGHASFVETPLGEVYLVHHCGRPFTPELRCTLGRESCIQKMEWTDDGWLRLCGGGSLALDFVPESGLAAGTPESEATPETEEFRGTELPINWYSPRVSPKSFASLSARPGALRLRGQESLCSLNRVSLLVKKLTSVQAKVETVLEFTPELYQEYAGLVLYYDNMNYLCLRSYWSETLNGPALGLLRLDNGKKSESCRIAAPAGPLHLRLLIEGRKTWFEWSTDGSEYRSIGEITDTSEFSDEYSKHGEFTGTFVGIFCVDSMLHQKSADFTSFTYCAQDGVPVT